MVVPAILSLLCFGTDSIYKDGVHEAYLEPAYSYDRTSITGYRLYAVNLSPGTYTDHDMNDATIGYSSNLEPVDSCEDGGDLVGCCDDQSNGGGGEDDGPGGDCSTTSSVHVGTFSLDGTMMTSANNDCAENAREGARNATFRAGIGLVLGTVALVAAEAFGGPAAAKKVATAAVTYILFEIDIISDNLAMLEHCLSHH
jgi:hypothetical protein